MSFIDSKTVFFIHLLTSFTCLAFISSLWVQNRKRYPEITYWFFSYILHSFGLGLILSRDHLHPIFSIILSNASTLLGSIILYKGLILFLKSTKKQTLNFVILILFIIVNIYYTFFENNISMRSINYSISLLLITGQISLFLFRQKESNYLSIQMAGVVFSGYVLVNLAYVFVNLFIPLRSNNLWMSGLPNTVMALFYLLLYIFLTFSLSLMVNRRLLNQLQEELTDRKLIELELRQSEEKFSKAFQTSPYAIAITRLKDSSFVDVNDAFIKISGYDRSELIQSNTLDLNLWLRPEARERNLELLRNGIPISGQLMEFRSKSGNPIKALFSAQTFELYEEVCVLSSLADITEYIQTQEELRSQKRFLSDIIELNAEIICIKDSSGIYKLVNKAWERAVGLSRDFVLGKTDEELFPGFVGKQFRANDLSVLESGNAIEKEEILESENGRRYFFSIKFPLRDNQSNITGLCAMITEITERKMAEEKIKHLATHDALTDLPGLRLAEERLISALAHAKETDTKLAVMFLDLDNFKNVNDTLGHEAGDELLIEIARRLRSAVGESDTIARIGGDEFIILVPSIKDRTRPTAIASQVLKKIIEPVKIKNTTARVGVSIGIAIFPEHGETMDELLRLADKAMYGIKRSGKNRYGYYR